MSVATVSWLAILNEHVERRDLAPAVARAMYPQYERMLWKWDMRLRRWIDGLGSGQWGKERFDNGAFMGWLYIVYVRAVGGFRPASNVKFSTYLWDTFQRSYAMVIREVLRGESESWARFLAYQSAAPPERAETDRHYAFHEGEYHLYRVPERDADWAHDVIAELGGAAAFWATALNGLPIRERRILERRWRHGLTLEAIGREERITKERVRQLDLRAQCKLRKFLISSPAYRDALEVAS